LQGEFGGHGFNSLVEDVVVLLFLEHFLVEEEPLLLESGAVVEGELELQLPPALHGAEILQVLEIPENFVFKGIEEGGNSIVVLLAVVELEHLPNPDELVALDLVEPDFLAHLEEGGEVLLGGEERVVELDLLFLVGSFGQVEDAVVLEVQVGPGQALV